MTYYFWLGRHAYVFHYLDRLDRDAFTLTGAHYHGA